MVAWEIDTEIRVHTAVVDESSHAFPVFIMEVLLYRLSRGSRSRDLTPPFSERDLHIFQPETDCD